MSAQINTDSMQRLVNDQFCKIFGIDDRAAIEEAAVYVERLPDNGRKFVTRYSGKDVNLVVRRAVQDVDAIDSYRSPTRSATRLVNGMYECDVTCYGLD